MVIILRLRIRLQTKRRLQDRTAEKKLSLNFCCWKYVVYIYCIHWTPPIVGWFYILNRLCNHIRIFQSFKIKIEYISPLWAVYGENWGLKYQFKMKNHSYSVIYIRELQKLISVLNWFAIFWFIKEKKLWNLAWTLRTILGEIRILY